MNPRDNHDETFGTVAASARGRWLGRRGRGKSVLDEGETDAGGEMVCPFRAGPGRRRCGRRRSSRLRLARTRTRRSDSPGRRRKLKFVERLAGGSLASALWCRSAGARGRRVPARRAARGSGRATSHRARHVGRRCRRRRERRRCTQPVCARSPVRGPARAGRQRRGTLCGRRAWPRPWSQALR